MSKIDLVTINRPETFSGTSAVNENFRKISEAIDNSVSRDGTLPNEMDADLDLNGNDLLNVHSIDTEIFKVDGQDIQVIYGDIADARDEALAAATRSDASADEAQGWAQSSAQSATLANRYASDSVSQGKVPIISSRDSAIEYDLSGFSVVEITRWSTSSLVAPAKYEKVPQPANIEPSHEIKFKAKDGSWFQYAEPTINPLALGVIGDYTTNDTLAFNRVLDYYTATSKRIVSGPMNIGYHGSRQLPAGIYWTGAGSADLDTWFAADGDSPYMRPGYKHLVSGTNVFFKGAATASHPTNRLDFPTIAYGFHHQSNFPPNISGVGFIVDFDMYTAGGALTTSANDNRANYGCGFIQQGPRGSFDDCLFRGFPTIQNLIIYGQASQSQADSDYNSFHRCMIQGFNVWTGDGSDLTVTQGCTGTKFDSCNFRSVADHHTVASGDYTRQMFQIDGYINGIAKGGIRGTTMVDCDFRTRSNDVARFDHCRGMMIIGGTSEFPTTPGVANADQAGKFTNPNGKCGTIYFLGFEPGNVGGAGIRDLVNSGADITTIGPTETDLTVARSGKFARIGVGANGNPFFQLGSDGLDQTSGWAIQMRADNSNLLSLRFGNSEKASLDVDGKLQIDGALQFASSTGPRQMYGTAIPTTGDWRRGDIIWNQNTSAGGKVGWTCITAGTPGTWKPFGAIDA